MIQWDSNDKWYHGKKIRYKKKLANGSPFVPSFLLFSSACLCSLHSLPLPLPSFLSYVLNRFLAQGSFSFFFLFLFLFLFSFFFTCLFLLLPSSTWSKSSMNDYPVRGTEQMDRVFLVAFRCSSAKSVWLHHHHHHHIFKKTRLSRKRSKGLGMGSAAFAISMERVLVCSVKAAKKRRFCFQTHRTWAFIWSAQFDFDVERDPWRIAINFSGCISCACPFRVYVPPCTCPSMGMSPPYVYPGVCMSRRSTVCMSLPCVSPECLHAHYVYAPSMCMSPPCVCPLRVYFPLCVCCSACMFLSLYVLSVCMSPPCMSRHV